MRIPARKRAQNLVIAVRASVDGMAHLKPQDRALVEMAVRYAEEIEETIVSAEQVRRVMRQILDEPDLDRDARIKAAARLQEAEREIAKVCGWLGPHLTNVMRALGGDAALRATEGGAVGGRLAQLRLARQGDSEAVDEAAS